MELLVLIVLYRVVLAFTLVNKNVNKVVLIEQFFLWKRLFLFIYLFSILLLQKKTALLLSLLP